MSWEDRHGAHPSYRVFSQKHQPFLEDDGGVVLKLQSAQQSLYSGPSPIFLLLQRYTPRSTAPCRKKHTTYTIIFEPRRGAPLDSTKLFLFFACHPMRGAFSAIGVGQEYISKDGHSATQS